MGFATLISIQLFAPPGVCSGCCCSTNAAAALLSPFAFPECVFVPKKGLFSLLELQLKTSMFSAVGKALAFEKLFSFTKMKFLVCLFMQSSPSCPVQAVLGS